MKQCIQLLVAIGLLFGLHRATAQVTFAPAVTYGVGLNPLAFTVADVNGDGNVDLITANWDNGDGSTLSVWTNNGSGIFVSNATYTVGAAPRSVVAADVNGDGKPDLTCENIAADTVAVLTNTTIFPSPTFTPPLAIHVEGEYLRVSWPSASAGWSLQQNRHLTKSNWGPSGYDGYDISDDGTNKSLSIPAQPGSLFFRLLHP